MDIKPKGRLTDLYISEEAIQYIRNWGVDEIDEQTKIELWLDMGLDLRPHALFEEYHAK